MMVILTIVVIVISMMTMVRARHRIVVSIFTKIHVFQVTDNGICELARFCPLSEVVVSGIHGLTDKSIFALTNSCTTTLNDVYASACAKITTQAFRYLKVQLKHVL